MSLLILLALGWTVGTVTANSKGYMYTNAGLDGKMFTEYIVFESAAKNTPHCALMCNHQDSCMSFTFNQNTCRGHAVLVTSNTTSVLAAGARSFYAEGKIRSCAERLPIDGQSGVRTVYTSPGSPLLVYCDQDTDNGGWTVFQRRQDGSVDFYRNWTEYQDVFGDLEGNFWLGLDALHMFVNEGKCASTLSYRNKHNTKCLDALHMLTSSQSYELRVDLMTFDGIKGYATYSDFTVGDSSDNYRLRFETFTGGNASNSLAYHNGMQFSTWDADHDTHHLNCAVDRHGAWWYKGCTDSNLNGRYKESRVNGQDGVVWYYFDGYANSLKFSEMKMRPL